ncbi:MAG TPA: NAD(P)H-dependent oxidoreductase subunit E [Rhizomicrobium sp.]|jgi:formate dehydrogenase subunit gamma
MSQLNRPWNETEARALIGPHTHRPGGLLPALHALQGEYGAIGDLAINVLADSFNVSRADVYGVVTFYHDFRTTGASGRHVLKLCRAEACQAVGCNALHANVQKHLGIGWHETTADGRLTLEPVFCLGLCASGPSGMIDNEPVAKLTTEKLTSLLDAFEP